MYLPRIQNSNTEGNIIENNIIKNVRNHYRLDKESGAIKDIIIKDIRTLS